MITKKELNKLYKLTNSDDVIFLNDKIKLINPFQTVFNLILNLSFKNNIVFSCEIEQKLIINNDNYKFFKLKNLVDYILDIIINKFKDESIKIEN